MARFLFSAFSDEAAKDLEGQIAACKANGITHMELRGVNGINISLFDEEAAEELKETLDAAGMKVSSIGSFYGKIPIDDDFEEQFEQFKVTVKVADILEAEYIRMFSFYIEDGKDPMDYKDEVLRRVTMMAEYAAKRDILCCHENERGIFGATPECCLYLHEALGDKLGCILDPANYLLCGVDPVEAFNMLEPYITYMHIKDAIKAERLVVPAGKGDGGLEEILRRLAVKPERYFLSVEPHLKVFAGFAELEQDDSLSVKMKEFSYPDNKASFAAACGAIHELVEKIQPLRVGIIGVGNMGSSHMNSFMHGMFPEMRLAAVADINPARLEWAKSELADVQCFDSGLALIESGSCDAVIIATPHYDHPPLVMAALQNGVHALSEKPAGVYTKQVRELNEFAAKSDKTFAIMFNQRTNHTYRKLREMVQGGEYGQLRRVSWLITDWYRTQAYYNSGGWRATWAGEGGGVLLNQCPHNLDLWQWICGMPCKVQATCHEGKWHDIEVEDDVTIYAEYENGATGVFVTTTGDYPGTNRLEITLDRAKLVCEGNQITAFELDVPISEHLVTAKAGFGKPSRKPIEIVTDGENPQHVGVLNAFASHILHGTPLVAGGEEGINGLTISNAAHLSSWLGRPVTLPIDEDLFYAELQKKITGSKKKEETDGAIEGDMAGTFGQ